MTDQVDDEPNHIQNIVDILGELKEQINMKLRVQ